MRYHVIADTHFNHHFMVESNLRLADFDHKLLNAVRAVPKGSTLIHLGDVSLGCDKEVHEMVNAECPASRRVMIRGNHDQRSPGWYLERGWSHVTDGMVLRRYGKTILFTHEPVPIPDWVDVNVHGHLHAGVHRKGIDDGKHLLVSCETMGYRTFELERLLEGKFTPRAQGVASKQRGGLCP